jgi:hypothetical protein
LGKEFGVPFVNGTRRLRTMFVKSPIWSCHYKFKFNPYPHTIFLLDKLDNYPPTPIWRSMLVFRQKFCKNSCFPLSDIYHTMSVFPVDLIIPTGKIMHTVPGEKINILVGHSIGHFKQKEVYIYTCVLFLTVSEIYLFHSTAPKLAIRKRYYTFYNTGIYCSNDRVGTVYQV